MMSIDIQFIRKRPIMKEIPLLTHHQSMPILLLPPVSFNAKPNIKFARFCTQIAALSTTPPDRSVAIQFLINECGLTDEDITKTFRRCPSLIDKSRHNLKEVLELFNGCGLTTPSQIRRVVLCNHRFFFNRSERDIESKLSFFRTFMKEEDIAKLIMNNARVFNDREDKLKSAISLLRRLGIEGDALSKLVARQPRLLMTSEEIVRESFKRAEDLGIKKESKMFATAMRGFLGVGKEKIEQRLQFLSSLGFSEKQISDLSRRQPWILGVSEEKVKRNLEFLVNSVGLLLDDFVKYPSLLGYSLETRIIPRYRVLKALKSMKLVDRPMHFPTSVYLTEKRFVEKYIDSNAESSVLWDIYNGGKDEKFIDDS